MKLRAELDLRTGALARVGVESGRSADRATARQHVRRGEGALRITDLGYFCVGVSAAMTAAGEHFLSRLQFGTGVRSPDGTEIEVLGWLTRQGGPLVGQSIRLGLEQRLACRLIAWRLPAEPANRRRQKVRADRQPLGRVIDDLVRVVATTCRRNRRKKPGTVELLNDVGRLDFRLT